VLKEAGGCVEKSHTLDLSQVVAHEVFNKLIILCLPLPLQIDLLVLLQAVSQ
jgi:hypothetical protein